MAIALLLPASVSVFAAQFSARVVDNLGQPAAGATLSAHCTELDRNGFPGKRHELFSLTSGPDGTVSGDYQDRGPACEKRIEIASDGTPPRHYRSFRPVFVVKRRASADQIHEILRLHGSELQVALRNFITSAVEGPLDNVVFQHADLLRSPLRTLATDPDAGIPARKLLAFIGDPDDLRLVVDLGTPKTEDELFEYRWLYDVLCSLLSPDSDAEWDLLRHSALGDFHDGWAFGGAIQSLRLMASPRSREILEEVSRDKSPRGQSALRALQYIDTAPTPLRDQDLQRLGVRVGKLIGGRSWTSNQEPLYDDTFDRALINVNLNTTSDYFLYSAVFQRVDGIWILRGVREGVQALKARR